MSLLPPPNSSSSSYPTPPPSAMAPSPGYYAYGPGDAYYIWPTAAYGADGSGEECGGRPRRPPGKSVKKRANNNNKERKRTRSINAAFCLLRSAIPQIPPDTKLSKIKTLKLATSYIVHLMDILEERKSPESFREDVLKVAEMTGRSSKRENASISSGSPKSKKASGRTGWPQHVWSLELKNENPSQQT